MGTVGCLLSVRSREPMECDLSVSIICLFFPLSSFILCAETQNIYRAGQKEKSLLFGTPFSLLVQKLKRLRREFFFMTPSAPCLTFHEEKFVHHVLLEKKGKAGRHTKMREGRFGFHTKQ